MKPFTEGSFLISWPFFVVRACGHTSIYICAILLKLFGAILIIAGLAGLLIGLSSMGMQTPAGSSYINAFMADFAVLGSISAIGTGFTLIVFGQMLELTIILQRISASARLCQF